MDVGKAPGPLATGSASQRRLGIRQNFAWTAFGTGAFALSQWAAVVALARLLDAAAVGEWAFAFAVVTPVFLFFDLQLRIVYVTDVDNRFALGDYMGLRLVTIVIGCLGLGAFAVARAASGQAALTLLGVCAAKAAETASGMLYGIFQKRDRMDLMTRSLLLRGPLALAALTWAVYATRQVYWGAVATAAVWLVVLLVHDVPTALRFSRPEDGSGIDRPPLAPRWSSSILVRLFRVALPLGIVTGLVSLNASVPRYFLEAARGSAELGIFSAMSYCVMAGGLLVNALGQSVVSRLSRLYSTRDERGFRALLIRLVAIGLGLGILAVAVAYFAGGPILEVLYGREYAARPGAFLVVVLGGSIGYVSSFLGYGMTAARFFRVQAPLFGSLVALNALSCALLVPRLGLLGAALATVVTALAGLALSVAVNLRALRDLQG